MVTLEAALVILVGLVAVAVAARYGGRWLPFLLAGAAGWLAAQVVKGVVALPFAGLPTSAWFPVVAAILPGVFEELGKYVPLRWLRVQGREQALALGLGAGALEAVLVGLPGLVGALGFTTTAAGLLIAVWERAWAVTLHAGLATLDGVAVYLRRGRWLVVAMAVHFAVDLPAGQYQHVVAVGGRGALTWLAVTEIAAPLLAIATLVVGRALWRRAGAGPVSGQ